MPAGSVGAVPRRVGKGFQVFHRGFEKMVGGRHDISSVFSEAFEQPVHFAGDSGRRSSGEDVELVHAADQGNPPAQPLPDLVRIDDIPTYSRRSKGLGGREVLTSA